MKRKEISRPSLFSPVDVLGTNYLLKADQNERKVQMSRIYFSTAYRFLYLLAIFLSLVCAVWILLQLTFVRIWMLAGIEGLIICMLIGDVLWVLGTQGAGAFFREWKNIADSIVTAAAVCLLILGLLEDWELEELAGLSLSVIKCCIQYWRLRILLKGMHTSSMSVIDLDEMSHDDNKGDSNKSGIVLQPNAESMNSDHREGTTFIADGALESSL